MDAEAIIAERQAQAAMEIDENDAAHNSTVREYEAVNVSSSDGVDGGSAAVGGVAGGAEEEEEEHQAAPKKLRKQ